MKKLIANYKPVLWLVLVAFIFNTLTPPAAEADVSFLPAPGRLVSLTPSFSPPLIRGLKIFKDNPFKFDFIMSEGDTSSAQGSEENSAAKQAFLKEEGNRLVKYFLASLTIPEKDMWVNLSPYERDRIVPTEFGITEMGKELLAQDYLLKQVTASVMYPEGNVGREFWRLIYQEAYKRFGTTNISVNTFNKVWIVPGSAVVYENAVDNTVVIVESKLNVMLEEDYLAANKSARKDSIKNTTGPDRQLSNELIREIILPLLKKEVNTGKNFAVLRQVYNSLILALWYKSKLKQSLISKGYVDRKKVNGVEVKDKNVDQEIYRQYLKSYKKGVYNYIKEEVSPTNEIVPRKYFSGGVAWGNTAEMLQVTSGPDSAQLASRLLKPLKMSVLGVELSATFNLGALADTYNAQGDVLNATAGNSQVAKIIQERTGTKITGDQVSRLTDNHVITLEGSKSGLSDQRISINLAALKLSANRKDAAQLSAPLNLQAELEIVQQGEQQEDKLKAFNKILAAIVNDGLNLSDPQVLGPVVNSVLAFHQAGNGALIRERILAYKKLLEMPNRLYTVLSPQPTAIETELGKVRADLTEQQQQTMADLLQTMQEEYLTLEPWEAINELNVLPVKIESAPNTTIDTENEIAKRIAAAREGIENIFESLSWDSDTLFSREPVTLKIAEGSAVKYNDVSGKIEIGEDALSLDQDAFIARLQKEFRKALIHRVAQGLGKILGADRDTQDLLEGKMASIVGKGTTLSEFILFCNISDGLTVKKVSDFLDLIFAQGELGYDKVEQYIGLKQHVEGRTTSDVPETSTEPRWNFLKPVLNFLTEHPAVAMIPIVIIAAAGSLHAADLTHAAGGGLTGSFHPAGFLPQVSPNIAPSHQAPALNHVLGLESRGEDVTKIGSVLMNHVNADDVRNLAGQYNPITGNPYDEYLSKHADSIIHGAQRGIQEGVFNMDVQRVVVAYEHAHGLSEDGSIGKQVLGALNSPGHAGNTPHLGAAVNSPQSTVSDLPQTQFDFTDYIAQGGPVAGAEPVMSGAGPLLDTTESLANYSPPATNGNSAAGSAGAGPPPVDQHLLTLPSVPGKVISSNTAAAGNGSIDQHLISSSQASRTNLFTDRQNMQAMLQGKPINYHGTEIRINMDESARKNFSSIQDQLYSGHNQVMAVIGSIDPNNLHTPLQVISNDQLSDFLYDKDTETIAKAIPLGTEPIDLSNADKFTTIDPADIHQYELAGKPFLTLVKFRDANGMKQEGILWAGEEAAQAKFDFMQSALQDMKMQKALVNILGMLDPNEQRAELAKPEMAELFKDVVIPATGLLTTVKIIPDKWNNIGSVERFITEGEIVSQQKLAPFARQAYVIKEGNGSSRELEYLSSLPGVWIQFTEISQGKEDLLNDKEHGSQYLDQYFPDTVKQELQKPRYMFGPNTLKVQINEGEIGKYAADREREAVGKNLVLQKSRRNLSIFLDAVTLPLSAFGLPGGGVIQGVGNVVFDLTHQIKATLPGTVSDEHKDELVGWSLFSMDKSNADNHVTFEEWLNTRQTNPQQFNEWKTKGHVFRTSAFSERQIAEMDSFLRSRMNEAQVGKFMGVVAEVTSLTGQVVGSDTKTVVDRSTLHEINPKAFIYWESKVPKLNGLVSVLTQPVVAWDGSSINLIQTASMIIQGKPLNYISIQDMIRGGIKPTTLLPYIGLSLDTRSFINSLDSDALNPKFINAPKHLRLNIAMPLLPISQNWEIAFSKEMKALYDDDSIEAIVVEDGLLRSHAHGYTAKDLKALSIFPAQAKISVAPLTYGHQTINVPVYVKYDQATGKKTVLILKANAIQRTIDELERTLQTYNDYQSTTEEGALSVQVSADGGTYWQNNPATHLYASYDQAGQIYYPLGMSTHQLQMALRAIGSNDMQKAKDILTVYYDHFKANTKVKGEHYTGAPESIDVENDQAASKVSPEATALFGLAMLKFHDAYPNEQIGDMDGALRQIHNSLLFQEKRGLVENNDMTAYEYAFMAKYGDVTAAGNILNNVAGNSWDANAHLIRYKGAEAGFASSSTLLWLRVLGPAKFAETFLGGADKTDGLLSVVDSIANTFGTEDGKAINGLDAVDSTLRPQERGPIVFVSETSDFVGVMKQILSTSLITPLNDQQSRELQDKIKYYSESLKALQSKGGSPSIPEATESNVRSGKDYFTAVGNKSLGSYIEYETRVLNDVDLLSPTASSSILPVLPDADPVPVDEQGRTRVVAADKNERERTQRDYQALYKQQKAGQASADGRYVEWIDPTNGQEVVVSRNGVTKHIVSLPSQKEAEDYEAFIKHQLDSAHRYGQALRGEGEFSSGAVIINRVAADNTVGDEVTIDGNDILNSSDMMQVMQQIQHLPSLQKHKIERQRYSNFTMDLDLHGFKGRFVVSIVFPHKGSIMTQVNPDSGDQTVEVYNEEGLKTLSIGPREISVPEYNSLNVESASRMYANTLNHTEGLTDTADYVAQIRQMVAANQLPLDGMTYTVDYRDVTVTNADEMISRKIFIDMRDGNVQADSYGVYSQPIQSSNSLYTTKNRFNTYGLLQGSDVFNNGREAQAPLSSVLSEQDLLARLLNPVQGDHRFVYTTAVNGTDQDLSRFNGILPVVTRDVITGVNREVSMDMSTGLKIETSTNANGVRQQTQLLYDKQFFSGRIPVGSVTKGSTGSLVKFTRTLDYNDKTQQIKLLEVDMTSGKRVETTKTFDARWEGYTQLSAYEGATASISTKVQYNRDGTSATAQTYRHTHGQTALLSEDHTAFVGGHYHVTTHKFSEGSRNNIFETTKSVISPANGLLLNRQTFNPLFPDTLLREFIPHYDGNGVETNNGREYTFSTKYDRQNRHYDGTIAIGGTNSKSKSMYYFRNNSSGAREIYTVKGELLTDANKNDVVGRFINRGTVQLTNVPAAQSAYSGRPLSYIEEQDDQGDLLRVHYVSEIEDRVVANAFKSTYEPNEYEFVFKSAAASNNIYGMTGKGNISANPVAISTRQNMLRGIPNVFGPNGQGTIDSMLYQRRDFITGAFEREYGLNAFGDENLNLYYSPGMIQYNLHVPGGYQVRGKAIVGDFDQPERPIFSYNDQYQLLDINAKPVDGRSISQQDLIGKATRLNNITFDIPSLIQSHLPGGLNTLSKEEDYIKNNERYFALNTADNRPVIEFNALPSDQGNFVAQVIYNPFTTTAVPTPDRSLYRAYLQGGNHFVIDPQQNVITTVNINRKLSMDSVMDNPIIKAAIGSAANGTSNHSQDARVLFEKTVRDIAHELGGDPSKFTFNISNDTITNDGSRFFVRIDQDPEARVILYVSSDQQPSLIVNMEFSGQSPLNAYEISQDGQIYSLFADKPQTIESFLQKHSIPETWKQKELAGTMIFNQRTVTPVSRYLLSNPVVDANGAVTYKGRGLVLVRLLGDNDPLSRDSVKLDRSAVRFMKYDESGKLDIPLTVPQGEIAIAKVDGKNPRVIRETDYFTRDKNQPEYIYKVGYEYKDSYEYTGRNNIFIGYNFKTGLTWEHYVNDEIKIYSLDSFPIESVRVPATLQQFENGIYGVSAAPQEYLYSKFRFKTLFGQGTNGGDNYIKTDEVIQTMTPNAAPQARVVNNNEMSFLIDDGSHYALDVFEKSHTDQFRNSPIGSLLPSARGSRYGEVEKIDGLIETKGEDLVLRNALPKLPVWEEGLRKHYYVKWVHDKVPFVAKHPVVNNWIAGITDLLSAGLSVLLLVRIVSSRWLKGVWHGISRLLGAAKSVNANNASFDGLSQAVGKEIARKLLVLRQVNGQFITAANVREEGDKKNYLKSYLLNSGFNSDEFDVVWDALSSNELTFNRTDNDPREAMEAVNISSGLDEEALKALIAAQAVRGYPQALALQEIISRKLLGSVTLTDLLARVPASYQGQMAWSQLVRLALIESENRVLGMLAANDPQAVSELHNLIITPEVRLLTVLVDNGYLKESDLVSLANEYLHKPGALGSFKEFAFQTLTEQVINPAVDDVYNSTFKYAGEGINPDRLVEVRQSITSEVHRFLMLDPTRITAKSKEEKAGIEYNPFPMTKLLETNNIRQFVLFKFIQMAPSDTGNYSLGPLSLFYPLTMFITGDAMRTLDASQDLSEEDRAKKVLTRIKAHADFWRPWFAMNLWQDGKPGLFKLLTEPEEKQPEEFRQTDLFIDTDLYKLMMSLNRLEDGKGYLLFGEMARMILAGGFDPSTDRQTRNAIMARLVEDAKNGKGTEITNDELVQLSQEAAQSLGQYKGYINQGANKQSSPQYTNFMGFIKDKILTKTDVFKETMLVFLKERSPYAVAADQLTKTWRGITHLWLVRIITPLAFMFKSFWAVPSGWKRAGAYALTAAGLTLSVVILATQEHMMAWGILTGVLALGWPKMVFGKVKVAGERLFWMSVYGVASAYQFGILVHHLFGKLNTIHYDTFGFAMTVFLFSVMTLPTYLSTFHMFNALWSYVRLAKRTWSKDFISWIGIPAFFRFGPGDSVELYRKIIIDAVNIETRFSPVTPNGEPVQEFLKRVLTRSGLFTRDELADWVNFIDNPQKAQAPKPPHWDKAQEFLYMTFFALIQKKPQTDNPAYLQASSSHVQVAGELIKNLFEIKSLRGSFDQVKTKQGVRETSLLGHLLNYHQGKGLENVLVALREKGFADFADKLERITATDDINKLLSGLDGDQVWQITQILEKFLDEVTANNYAVIESQGIDITEMHIYMALHMGDYAYADAVTEIAKEYPSLKAAKIAFEGRDDLTPQEELFNKKYAAYSDLVLLKYRPIFQEASIWAQHIERREDGFVFNTAGQIFNNWDSTILHRYFSDEEVLKLQEAQGTLQSIFSDFKNHADNLIDFSTPVLSAREKNIQQIIDMFSDEEFQAVLAKAKATLKMLDNGNPDKKEIQRVDGFIENYDQFIQIIIAIDKTYKTDVYLPFYKKGELDNPIPRNKNGGIGANLWIGNGRSSNYDAWVRAYPGQNSYRLSWATLVGRNPEIMIANPIMRIWASSNEAFPVTSHYAIAQHTWTSDTQRGREDLETFYGKGLITPGAGNPVVSHTGEDSAAFLAMQDEYPRITSTQLDYFGFEWGRPTLIKTIYTTEQRYGFNVTLFTMYRSMFSVLVNPDVSYDVKLTHLALFMHYISVRLGLLLMISLPFGSMFSSFANLTPAVILTGVSYLFMISVNFGTLVRHLRETGSVWTAIRRTARDTAKAHPMFVGILVMIDKGIWSATHEIFKFARTIKTVLLGGEKDEERYKELKLFTLPENAVLTKLPFYGIIGTLGFASWAGTLFVSLSNGPFIYLPYLMAAIAALTSHKVYGAFYNEKTGKIKGVSYARMFGSSTGMKVFAGLLLTRIFSDSFGLIDSEVAQSVWGVGIIAAAGWALMNVGREGLWWAIRDFGKFLFSKISLQKPSGPSNPSGPAAAPVTPTSPAPLAPSLAPKGTDKAMLVGMARQITSNIYPVDRAMQAGNPVNRLAPGGIDLGKTVVSVEAGSGIIQTAFDDPAMLRLLLNADGLAPIIYNIRAMTPSMVDHFVGVDR